MILLALIVGAVFCRWIAPYDPYDLASLNLMDSFQPPAFMPDGTPAHLLGSDDQGRDMLSAILFGGSFLSVVVAVTAFARKAAKPHAWTAVIAVFTVAFGLGQCIGPILSGALSD